VIGGAVVDPRVLGLSQAPGHLIRRAQQVHTAIWAERLHGELTGPQYASLVALGMEPGIDQSRLAELASLDKNTATALLRRLVAQGWVERSDHPDDARRRVLRLTTPARAALRSITPAARLVQQDLLQPLAAGRRAAFVEQLASVALVGDLGELPPARKGAPPDIPLLTMHRTPGYLLRRAQRVHGGIWARTVGAQLTPPQYAVLSAVEASPGCDQATVGRLVSLDTSSTADVVARLVRAGWIEREPSATHGRRASLRLAPAAPDRLTRITTLVRQVQEALLHPLGAVAARSFVDDLATVAYRGALAVA
jgi:MarR family transcriptional regulator, lower aerobic nicotinate degradation pathway regulator